MYPERFELEGIIGANYNNGMPGSGPDSPRYSCDLIHKFLKASGLDGKYPVKWGAHPMQYLHHPSQREGVDFIIQRAHAGSADDPLWVVGLGAATDLASGCAFTGFHVPMRQNPPVCRVGIFQCFPLFC